MNKKIGIIGAGTIGGFVIDKIKEGAIQGVEVVAVCVRNENSKGVDKVKNYEIPLVTSVDELLRYDLDVIVEAANQETLEQYGEKILSAKIDLIPISLGAFVDGNFLETLTEIAKSNGSILHIPSGGIGALDALQAATIAGVDEVEMTTRKPPEAWTNIPFVDDLKIDLNNVQEEIVLFEGPARDCVKVFPQNINIAADLSMAGIGFDKTKIKIIIDPEVKLNTHQIKVTGKAGVFTVTFENLPVPSNPKTTYQACLSVLASLQKIRSHYHMGS